MNCKKLVVTLSLVCLLLFLCTAFLFVRGGYYGKILIKFGIKENIQETNWTARSWTNCIEQLDLDVDVAFFGDSITYGGQWADYYQDIKIINLGYAGDNLIGMQSRVEQLVAVKPEKIFIMAGINGLKTFGIDKTMDYYRALIDLIEENIPTATIYVESILPIAEEKEKDYGSNISIQECNAALRYMTEEYGITYIDLWSLYQKDGTMNAEYTSDGVHLQKSAYQIWKQQLEEYIYLP